MDTAEEHQPSLQLEWPLHQHITHALQGLLPGSIRAHRLKNVLDINCRIGAWATDLALSYPGLAVTGIEENPFALRVAQSTNTYLEHLYFHQANLKEPLIFADCTFDLIHLSTPTPLLKPREWYMLLQECMRVLKPGGYINLVATSLGPNSSAACQRGLALMDELWLRQGYTFAEMPGSMRVGIHFPRLLSEAGYTEISYKMRPTNYGGLNNPRGRACCRLFFHNIQKSKNAFIAYKLIEEAEFEHIVQQQQQDIAAASYCATGVVISAFAIKK